jgi:hypothetical protein
MARIDGKVRTFAEETGWNQRRPGTLACATEPLSFLLPG